MIVALVSLGALLAVTAPSVAADPAQREPALVASDAILPRLSTTLLAGTTPVVILFSTPGCPYCRALRREHLDALRSEQEHRGVVYLELDLVDHRPFAGESSASRPAVLEGVANGRELAQRLSVKIAPTVVFLGPQGEVAERLVGYGARDFYAAYLDQRLDDARQRLRSP